MTPTRTIFLVFFCGLVFPSLFDRVVEGEWPSRSVEGWLVTIAGLVVIAAVFIVGETVYRARKRADTEVPSGG